MDYTRHGPDTGRWLNWLASATGTLERDTDHRTAITSPEAAARTVMPLISDLPQEAAVALLLDTKHRLITTELISLGSADHTFMGPREVYRAALIAGATALVIAHNHPSGDPEPSRDDQAVTRNLHQAGKLLNIDLLDHIIIGGSRWVSLARRHALP